MTTFNDLLSDIIYEIAIKLDPKDLYNFALTSSRYAQIIKNRKVINFHIEEKNEIDRYNRKLKYYVFKHTGKKHGLYESWHSDEQKSEQLNFQNDKVHGLHECWYDNGQKMFQFIWQNGQKHGLQVHWYKNGQMMEQINYRNGEKHGLCENWYENGRKYAQINYQNDAVQN